MARSDEDRNSIFTNRNRRKVRAFFAAAEASHGLRLGPRSACSAPLCQRRQEPLRQCRDTASTRSSRTRSSPGRIQATGFAKRSRSRAAGARWGNVNSRNGVLNDLRSSKEEGQSNFNNPSTILAGGRGGPRHPSRTAAVARTSTTSGSTTTAINRGAARRGVGAQATSRPRTCRRPRSIARTSTRTSCFRLSGAIFDPGAGFRDLFATSNGDKRLLLGAAQRDRELLMTARRLVAGDRGSAFLAGATFAAEGEKPRSSATGSRAPDAPRRPDRRRQADRQDGRLHEHATPPPMRGRCTRPKARSSSAAPIVTAATRSCPSRRPGHRQSRPALSGDPSATGRTSCRAIPQVVALPDARRTRRQSYTLLNREAPRVRPLRQSVRLPDRARELRRVPHGDDRQAAERSLMATGAMFFGGASVQQRHIAVQEPTVIGEAYTRRPASRRGCCRRGRRRGMLTDPGARCAACCSTLYPLPKWQVTPPADIFRVFERGGRNIGSAVPRDRPARCQWRSCSASKSRDGPTSGRAIAAPATGLQHLGAGASTSTRRGSTTRSPGSWAPTTSPATTALRAAPPATSSMPTTASRAIRVSGQYGRDGTSFDRRPDDPQGRVGPPDPARLHQAPSRRRSA